MMKSKSLQGNMELIFPNTEIRALRPLLDEISFHWLFTGIPETFINKIRGAIGDKKTEILFKKYLDSTK